MQLTFECHEDEELLQQFVACHISRSLRPAHHGSKMAGVAETDVVIWHMYTAHLEFTK